MKLRALITTLILSISVSPLFAEIRFPSNSFEASELAEAQAAAEKSNKPIAFVYTDKDTTCGLCQNATGSILRTFRTSAVVVYVKNYSDIPKNVSKLISSQGKYIPKVALLDASLTKEYGLVTYEQIRDDGDRALRDLKTVAARK